MGKDKKVLVFGDDSRSFLATVRSLGQAGYIVDAAPFDLTSPALRSRYLNKIVRLPPYSVAPSSWVEILFGLIDENGYDVIVPCDERALIPLNIERRKLEEKTLIAIPSEDNIEVLFDKVKTRELAVSVGVPVAQGQTIKTKADIKSFAEEYGFPLLLKPGQSYYPHKLFQRQSVTVVRNEEDVDASRLDESVDWFVECFWPGKGVGVSILAQDGQLIKAFQHERVREPKKGGGSSYRFSSPLRKDLLKACDRMVGALSYTGVAMFEFRCSEDSYDFILLEVNARPWGSLPLAISSGVDFPKLWVDVLLNHRVKSNFLYKHHMYGRNLLADLYNFREEVSLRPTIAEKITFTMTYVAEFRRILRGREAVDAIRITDPIPGVVETFSPILQKVGRMALSLFPLNHVASALKRRSDYARLKRFVSESATGSLIFVCQGNIYRSCFAEFLAKVRCKKPKKIEFRSAGVLPRVGRTSPAAALAEAEDWNVDLSQHRSKYLREDMVRNGSLLVVFDNRTREDVMRIIPNFLVNSNIINLYSFDIEARTSAEIEDPYGKPPSFLKHTYTRIDTCIGRMCDEIPLQ